MILKALLKNFIYVLKHKFYVLRECYKAGITWLGIIHDWDKFMPLLMYSYAIYYYTDQQKDDKLMDEIFKLHYQCSPHHWELWNGDEMPIEYVKEMGCDLNAMGYSYPGALSGIDYYKLHKDEFVLHPKSRKILEDYLGYVL